MNGRFTNDNQNFIFEAEVVPGGIEVRIPGAAPEWGGRPKLITYGEWRQLLRRRVYRPVEDRDETKIGGLRRG